MVECGGLENRFSPYGGTGVRIPLSPQSLNELLRPLAEDYLFYQRHEESSLSGVAADKTNKKPAGVHLSFAGISPRDHRR